MKTLISPTFIFASLGCLLIIGGFVAIAWQTRGKRNQSMSPNWQESELPKHEHERDLKDGFLMHKN